MLNQKLNGEKSKNIGLVDDSFETVDELEKVFKTFVDKISLAGPLAI